MSEKRVTLSDDLLSLAQKKNSNYTEPDLSAKRSETRITTANADYLSRIALRKDLVKWILIFGSVGFIIMSIVIFYLIYQCSRDGIDANELEKIMEFLKWYLSETLIEIFLSIAFTVKQVFSTPKAD